MAKTNLCKTERIGETNIANNGMQMTIIEYRGSNDIDIMFEDGMIIRHKQYSSFKRGEIGHPTIKAKGHQPHTWHIGETSITNSGHLMTIIDWHNQNNISIKFDDDVIIHNKRYSSFKKGSIAHPKDNNNWHYPSHLGEIVTKSNGESMTITKYTNSKDFEVTFSDGTTVHRKRYTDNKKGFISNPNSYKNQHIGEETIAKNGLHAKIINCENCRSITVQFEDGTKVITNYRSFKEGNIKHPNISVITQKCKNKYIGKTFIAKNGMSYTVVDYKNAGEILIEFEDGTQVTTTVSGIYSNNIKNPNYTFKTKRIGETNLSSIGLQMSVYNYRSAMDIDIQFEDGYIATNRSYTNFKTNSIEHKWPYQMDNILIQKPAYVYNNEGNFYCKCIKCNHEDIWNIQEMKEHVCN